MRYSISNSAYKTILFSLLLIFSLTLKAQTTVSFTTLGSSTFTVPPCVTQITVQVWGGGGGGGGAWSKKNNSGDAGEACGAGGGGGGGGFTTKTFTVIPGETYSVTVGGGGTAGANTPTAGGNGGTSSFSGYSINLTATGGVGGGFAKSQNSSGTTDRKAGAGGAGGTGSGGTSNYSGGAGRTGEPGGSFDKNGAGGGGAGPTGNGAASTNPVNDGNAMAGGIGNSPGGNGGSGDKIWTNNNNKAGKNGGVIGGGGSGGLTHIDGYGTVNQAGGAGGRGEVRVIYTAAGTPAVITAHPTAIQICTPGSGSYSVTATNATGYLWEYYDAGTASWYSTVGLPTITNQTTNTISLTNSPEGWSGIPIRCKVTGACGDIYSNVVLLDIRETATAPTSILSCPDGTLTASGGSGGDIAWSKASCGNNLFLNNFDSYPYTSYGTTVNSSSGGLLNLTSTNGDPMIEMPSQGSFDPTIYRYINIRYKVISGTAGNAEVFFFNTTYPGANGNAHTYVALTSDNNWHTATIDMTMNSNYLIGGNITGWRYDWATNSGVNMQVDYITLSQFPMGTSISVTPSTGPETYYAQRISNCLVTSCVSTVVLAGPSNSVSIPHERSDFATQTGVTGWSGNYTVPTATANPTHDCAGLPVVLNAVNNYAWVNYSSNASKLSYSLKLNNPAGARTIVVEESVDGCTWTSVATHTNASSSDLVIVNYIQSINSASRHVRFRMTARTAGRVEVDNVKIYNSALTYPTALSANGQQKTCAVYGNHWVNFYAPDNTLIGSVNANASSLTSPDPLSSNDLGNLTLTSYVGAPGTMFACNGNVEGSNTLYETAYMGRNWVISSTKVPHSAVSIRLPFKDTELTALTAKALTTTDNPNDDVSARGGLFLSKYSGSTENATPHDNCAQGVTNLFTQTTNGVISSITEFSSLANAQYVNFSIPSFSELYLHGATNSPLPVTLTHFSASCHSEIQLKWSTASEQNSAQFMVEKSRDLIQWSFVSEVPAAGFSNYNIDYVQEDQNPWLGTAYYRLRQIDFNGDEKMYGPISISCTNEENQLTLFPNPSNGNFTVEINSTSTILQSELQIIDLTGKIVALRQLKISEGMNQVYFDQNQLETGMYILRLVENSDKFKPVRVLIK